MSFLKDWLNRRNYSDRTLIYEQNTFFFGKTESKLIKYFVCYQE
jgi:hypothetical protein